MSVPTHFNSGRTGAGKKFVADASGSAHARFMRLSSYVLTPLGILATWWLVGLVGLPIDRVREEIGHPFPALVLIAFAALGMIHAREGMHEIILDYVHDAELKQKAIKANKIISIAIVAIWVVSLMFIAAPH